MCLKAGEFQSREGGAVNTADVTSAVTTWGACMPGAKEESCWGLTPETSDVISWPRVEHELSRVEQNFHFLEVYKEVVSRPRSSSISA